MHRILYLGLDPSRYKHSGELLHCPIIQITPNSLDEETKRVWPLITHVLFTSPSAVKYWPLPLIGKQIISIGAATASVLPVPSITAPFATQEGVIALLDTLDLSEAYLFWPRSSRSRAFLSEYLAGKKIHVFDLYETTLRRPEVMPDLIRFDEIVFTSPSTVYAFLELFSFIPLDKKITSIGPVTAEVINLYRT